MSVVIGIDVGGSTTKIVGFENTIGGNRLIDPAYGFIGHDGTEHEVVLEGLFR